MNRLTSRLPLLAVLAALIYLSLVPWTFDFTRPFHHPAWQLPHSSGEIADSILNLLVYLPLGFIVLRTIGNFWCALLLGVVLSLSIEYLQVFLVTRDSSWRDVLLNSVGTLLGCAAARLPILLPSLPRLPADGLLCAALWFTAHCYPFLPVLRMSSWFKLRRTFEAIHWDGNAALDAAVAAVILCLLLPRAYAALALFGPLLLEAFILGQQLQLSALAGAAAGFAFGFVLPAPHATVLTFFWIALRQLQPFHWVEQATPFGWLPFNSLTDMPTAAYLRILIFKLFLYCGAVRLACMAGAKLRYAAAVLLVLLAVSEALQTHLPGRTPESTDLVLALLGVVLTMRVSGRQSAASRP